MAMVQVPGTDAPLHVPWVGTPPTPQHTASCLATPYVVHCQTEPSANNKCS